MMKQRWTDCTTVVLMIRQGIVLLIGSFERFDRTDSVKLELLCSIKVKICLFVTY